jgi:hypothetical protein
MCTFKRKRTSKSQKRVFRTKGRKGDTKKRMSKLTLVSMARRLNTMTKTIETKSGVKMISDGKEYLHNNLYTISSNWLQTNNSTIDSENGTGQRIGDKITLSGVAFTMMLELNKRYSDVTFRMFVVRSAKGDTPTTETLWNGASANKMLDTFNTERFTILFSKYVKITAPFFGVQPTGIQQVGSGFASGTPIQSRATRIVKFYIPGSKFTKNRILLYENGGNQVKFFDYHFMIYAYSNYSTVDTAPAAYFVGRLNDCFIKMHYKDA